jgi:surface protein
MMMMMNSQHPRPTRRPRSSTPRPTRPPRPSTPRPTRPPRTSKPSQSIFPIPTSGPTPLVSVFPTPAPVPTPVPKPSQTTSLPTLSPIRLSGTVAPTPASSRTQAPTIAPSAFRTVSPTPSSATAAPTLLGTLTRSPATPTPTSSPTGAGPVTPVPTLRTTTNGQQTNSPTSGASKVSPSPTPKHNNTNSSSATPVPTPLGSSAVTGQPTTKTGTTRQPTTAFSFAPTPPIPPGIHVQATPFAVTYSLGNTTEPTKANFIAADQIVKSYLNTAFGRSFAANPFNSYQTVIGPAIDSVNPTQSIFNLTLTFGSSSRFPPSTSTVDTIITGALSPPLVQVLISNLNSLPASNPFSTVTSVSYTANPTPPLPINIRDAYTGTYNPASSPATPFPINLQDLFLSGGTSSPTTTPAPLNLKNIFLGGNDEPFQSSQSSTASLQSFSTSSCFLTTEELQAAVQEYLADSSPNSTVAQRYGWPINKWCVHNLSNFSQIFAGATTFNEPLDEWDVSQATTLNSMFYQARAFNQDLSSWNTSKVTDMGSMFFQASAFNGSIASWDVSRVTSMWYMFAQASNFNGDISGWDTSKVWDMSSLFEGATNFNQNIDRWNVTAVNTLSRCFQDAANFRQNMCEWVPQIVGRPVTVTNMFTNSNCLSTKDPIMPNQTTGPVSGYFCAKCTATISSDSPLVSYHGSRYLVIYAMALGFLGMAI